MFFIMGITDGRKDFDFHQMMTCGACGAYASAFTTISLPERVVYVPQLGQAV